MIVLFDKFKSSVLQNKKFFLVYLIVILMLALFFIILYILGNIERKGYLSEFKQNIENNYGFKISYYSKIFRHGDIYGVYPIVKEKPEYIIKINFDGNGSPFGNLLSKKELDNNYRMSIYYKLKIKNNVIIFVLLFIFIFPAIYFYIIKNIGIYYRSYILFFILNSLIYFSLLYFILPKFSILKFNFNFADFALSYIFLMIAFNLLNQNILLTLIFMIFQDFSFFVIEPISLTAQNTILLFTDMPTLYPSLIRVLPLNLKIITIVSTILYFAIIILLIIMFIHNLIKMKRITSIFMITYILILSAILFFRDREITIWLTDFYNNANRNGIIDTINYKINYNRLNTKNYTKKEVENALNILLEKESNIDYSNLILTNSINNKRNIFLIFLESFYDYSHFTNLFEKDPFPEEYRKWANNSRKVPPNSGSGSFNARLAGLTASSPLYPKIQNSILEYTLTKLLMENGYDSIALEEAESTYNLNSFLPAIGFKNVIFNLGITNIDNYIRENYFTNLTFLYGFTLFGHSGFRLSNDLNIRNNNKKLLDKIRESDLASFIETLESSAITSIEIIKIRDAILKYYPNALIIFKHDHLYPYLRGIIENSSIDNDIKMSFLNDNAPTPILIWDGTNGAYKAPDNFVPENIPMFIAVNAGVTNYKNSMISLLYKEEIDGFISTYHKYYRVTNDTLLLENDIDTTSKIFKYENAQRILSQDIFQGKKYYYDLINISNK
ncbi:hypothetical protein [Brachyspira murdochii]|uniref:hypothetical protein n=1 Tax=Brachyspira murdochii TaxID=84378 RepID=UPI0018DFBD84|nr:hypothetical protein [Brachyspira murdochii]